VTAPWLEVLRKSGRDDQDWIAARYTENLAVGGIPYASGGSAHHAFDPDPLTFWISPMRGTRVKDQAFIAYRFPHPVHIRRIVLHQSNNRPYRQDRVRVQYSSDGGVTWRNAARTPLEVVGPVADLRLGRNRPAADWRLVAASDNATEESHAWTPMFIEMMAAHSYRDTLRRLDAIRAARVPSPEPATEAKLAAEPEAQRPAPHAQTELQAPGPDLLTPIVPPPFDRMTANELLADGRTEELLDYAGLAAAVRLDDPVPPLLAGHAARLSGDVDLAVEWWRRAHDIAPTDREVGLALLSGLYEQGRSDSPLFTSLLDGLTVDQRSLTVQANRLDERQAAAIYRRHGCVLMRGVVPPEDAERIGDRAVSVAANSGAAIARDPYNFTYPVNLAFADPDDRTLAERWKRATESGHAMSEGYMVQAELDRLRDFTGRWLMGGDVGAVLRGFLGHDPTLDPNYAMARVITPETGMLSVTAHQDARLQRNHRLFATAWVALGSCGPHAGTALGVIPVRLNNYFPTDDASTLLIDRDFVPMELFVDPDYAPGDVLFHSTYSIHRTIGLMARSNRRVSVDIRFF
jgi:hypothetical protein